MLYFKLFISFFIYFSFSSAFADYEYQLIEKDKHKIHIIIINPKEYDISLLAAHDQVFGREIISDIAKRVDAEIAINAGFFEIGANSDGMPTGTLINNGQIYGITTSNHACLIKKGDIFSIEKLSPSLEIKMGEKNLTVKKINKFARDNNIYYFNNNWGTNTLSSYLDRAEIIIDQDYKIIDIIMHGGNKIPSSGHILSLPINSDLSIFHIGQRLEFKWTPEQIFQANNFAVMGLPMLIKDNIVNAKLADSKDIHARTAVGIRKDGKLVLVVVEHHYVKPIKDVNLGDIKKIFSKEKVTYSNLTALQMQKIVFDNINSESEITGFTLLELANFMKEHGCIDAINLDGGGSSAMYVDGEYVNDIYGGKDEAEGQKIIRPVSDAIVFRKKNKP